MTDEVKFTNEQWDALAEAAEVFADALDGEQESLRNVLTKDWAGECEEGIGTIENLREMVQGGGPGSFTGAVSSEAGYLRSIAIQCREAKRALIAIDSQSSDGLQGPA